MATAQPRGINGVRAWVVAAGLLSLLLTGCPRPSSTETTEGTSAADPLDALKATYRKASSYTDAGELHIEVTQNGQKTEFQPFPFSVAFQRPNKLRVESFSAGLVCDGEHLWATVRDDALAEQVLYQDAPELSLKQIYSDKVLAHAITGGTELPIPQLDLLLADKPLAEMFGEGYSSKRLADEALPDDADQKCQVVEVTSKQGPFKLWIDPKSHALLRLDIPSAAFQKKTPAEQQADLHVWAEFKGARLGKPIDADKAFKFEAPPTAKLVKQFIAAPPEMQEPPSPLLGKRPERFKFVDLNGKTVDLKTLSGKVAVLDLWTTSCSWCFKGFPNLEKVQKQYADNDRVTILAVNNDDARVSDQVVEQAFEKAHVQLPIVRDPEGFCQSVFKVPGWPTTIILGSDGTVQDFEIGFKPDLAKSLPAKIERLLAGQDLARETIARYEDLRKDFDRRIGEVTVAVTQQIELPQAKIGERSEPSKLKLKPLWTAAGIKNPGNMLVCDGEAGPRIVMFDGWNAVVELDSAGKVTARHELKLPSTAALTLLRTSLDRQGQRYFVTFGSMEQQVFLFDNDWKLLLSYPAEGKHAGISDVQFADINDDGQLELLVGYMGEVGVQAVSLSGERLWSNREFDNVLSLAVIDAPALGAPRIFCTNERQAIGVIDLDGRKQADIPVPNRPVDVIVPAALGGPGTLNLAALASPQPAEVVALGLGLDGQELWNYPLPVGMRKTPCDPLVAVHLGPKGAGEWLLTGPDGSIHILSAQGELIDKFNYGDELTGVASAEFDGAPVLLVATGRELSAWVVDGDADGAADAPAQSPSTKAAPVPDAAAEDTPSDDAPAADKPADSAAEPSDRLAPQDPNGDPADPQPNENPESGSSEPADTAPGEPTDT